MEDKHCAASPLDITYCMNAGCPITQCERHLTRLKDLQKKYPGWKMVRVADLSGTCRDYIRHLLEEET